MCLISFPPLRQGVIPSLTVGTSFSPTCLWPSCGQLIGPQRTLCYAALSKSEEVPYGLDCPTLPCVTGAVLLRPIVSASVKNGVSWGWQIYSKTCRWWLSGTEANFRSPARCFRLWMPHFQWWSLWEWFLSCSATARNLASNFNLLCFLHNLCIKWMLCLKIVVVLLFWLVLDALGVSPGTRTHTQTQFVLLGLTHSATFKRNSITLCMYWSLDTYSQVQFMCCYWPYLLPFTVV